jgi:UPF0176 protein
MSVAFDDQPKQLGACRFCAAPTNDYYNCAYNPGNNLMLVCADCRPAATLCSAACQIT